MGFGSLPTTIIFACVITLSVSIITSLIFVSVKYSARTSYGIFDAISKSSSRFIGLMDSQTPRFLIQPYVVYKNCCYFMFGAPRDNVRFKKLEVLTLDQLNQIFPLQKYNEWLEGDKTVDISKVEYLENIDEKLVEHSTEPTHSETQADEIPNQKEQDITEMDIKNASMPRTDYKNEKHFTSGICAICIETLEEEDYVRGLICGHVFHDNCIDPWLTERRGCCPTCKKDLYMEINSNQIESPVSEETSRNEDEVNQTPVNLTYKISDYIKLPRRGDPGDMELDDLFNIDYSNPFTFFLVLKIFELQSKTLLLALQYIRNGTYYDHSSYSITESDDLIEFHVNENQISADTNQYITMFNSKFIQTIVSSDFYAPPLPSLQNINPQLRRIVESSPKPFNANDLIDLDTAAFEKTNKMTNGFNKVKFKILGIKKIQLYYYNVVSIYNERRHNRIQNHVVNNDTV